MHFNTAIIIAFLAASATAAPAPAPAVKTYHCASSLGKFSIQQTWAQAAMATGGSLDAAGKGGSTGFPHTFYGGQGDGPSKGTQLKFYGADARCNEKNPQLLEYPVAKDGKKIDKNGPRDTTTPARVVYLKDGKTLCGVMTHVGEDPKTHKGKGDFRVCDL